MANKIQFYRKTTTNINLTFPGVDLTGSTVYFTVKPDYDDSQDDSPALIQKDVTTHVNAPLGTTRVQLTPDDTNVKAGKYVFDIKLKKSTGERSVVSIGKCTIDDVVTLRG